MRSTGNETPADGNVLPAPEAAAVVAPTIYKHLFARMMATLPRGAKAEGRRGGDLPCSPGVWLLVVPAAAVSGMYS